MDSTIAAQQTGPIADGAGLILGAGIAASWDFPGDWFDPSATVESAAA